VAALALAACGSSKKKPASSSATSTTQSTASGQPGKGKPPVTIGDKNFTEEYVLGELYAQALRAKGFTVKLDKNIGTTEITIKALKSGQLDMYPEYMGIWLTSVAHDAKIYPTADAAYAAAKANAAKSGFTMLTRTPFTDVDALAVLPATAKKYGLSSVADLKKVKGLTLGAPPEFRNRLTGLVGLKNVYGITGVNFKPLAIGLQYQALDAGKIQAADVFTTDGQLQRGKYKVLPDPKNVFGFQNVVPVVNSNTLKAEGPAFTATLEAVSAKLTTAAMQKMNAAVDLDKQDPAAVAKAFLQANGLI
jgi:osmoprotectant transport system substrate-binding protein